MHIATRLTEIGAGVYIDPDPQATTASTEITAHYDDDAIDVLKADVGHYAAVKAQVLDGSPVDMHYGTVADIAGGHPKLASCLSCDAVTVYDRQAEDYRKHHDSFAAMYPDTAPVSYVTADITDSEFAPTADLAIFCHVIEHLTIKDGAELLRRVDAPRVLVYQPNIARANGENWFHYAPKDHITFYTIDAMAKVLWFAGFKIEFGVEFHQDYLLYGVKR